MTTSRRRAGSDSASRRNWSRFSAASSRCPGLVLWASAISSRYRPSPCEVRRPAGQAKSNRAPAAVGAQQVDGAVGRHPIKPRLELPSRIEVATLQVNLQEHRLESVLGQVIAAQVLAQVVVQLSLVATDEFLERRARAVLRIAAQQLFIRAGRPGRLAWAAAGNRGRAGGESACPLLDTLPFHRDLLGDFVFALHAAAAHRNGSWESVFLRK